MKKNVLKNKKGITLLALIISIIVLVILAGVAINTLYGENGIISNAQDVAILSNIKTLEEGIDLYKIDKNLEGKVEEDSYPIALNEDGSRITLDQMKNASELAKLPDEVKYALLNLTAEKGTTNIPSSDQIDYSQFYKLDYTKLNISQEDAENLVIYVEGDTYKVINLAGVKYKKNNIYVIIPLNNEAEPEYITVANNTYKLYGDGTLKALGEKTTNSGYTSDEVNGINNNLDEFNLKEINNKFNNRMSLPETLTAKWYEEHVYFSTGTVYVIDENSDLWAWGANDYNKLGLGNSFLIVEPTKILEGRCEQTKAIKVWAGATNTFFVGRDGNLYGCGTNSNGELGIGYGKTTDKYEKVDISMTGLTGKDIEYMSLSPSTSEAITIIKLNNGKVYACGLNSTGQLGNGNRYNIGTLKEQPQFENCKDISTNGFATINIDQYNTLYLSGQWTDGTKSDFYTLKKIKENVKEAEIVAKDGAGINIITSDGKILRNVCFIDNTIQNLAKDENATFVSANKVLSKGKVYKLSSNAKLQFEQVSNISSYKKGAHLSGNNKNMLVIKANENLYLQGELNITRIGEKSNYNLRKVFENAIFVNGNGNNISIVNREGKVYESTNSSSTMENVKKIIASAEQKYVITNDNHLYAKGNGFGAIWGDTQDRTLYTEIKDSTGKSFDNIKNIFTSSVGKSMVFQTTENEIYFGGNVSWISLPRNNW